MDRNALTDCPKCFTTGKLSHFAHVRGGVCFCCFGAKRVTVATANGWLAAQLRQDFGHATKGVEEVREGRPTKRIKLAGFGEVDIKRDSTGGFRVTVWGSEEDVGGLCSMDIRDGRVVLSNVSAGLDGHDGRLRAALQARHDAHLSERAAA